MTGSDAVADHPGIMVLTRTLQNSGVLGGATTTGADRQTLPSSWPRQRRGREEL